MARREKRPQPNHRIHRVGTPRQSPRNPKRCSKARIADGWLADEIGRRCSFFFCCVKDGVRLEVGIHRIHPDAPTSGHGQALCR
jgi:hypothetical protein